MKSNKKMEEKKGNLTSILLFSLPVVAVAMALIYSMIFGYKELPYYSFTPTSTEYVASKKPSGQTVSDFNFISQTGEKVNRQSLGECIYISDYIFTTCPGMCKTMTSQMTRVYKAFEGNPYVKILSHTSKPEEDSVDILMEYAKEYGVRDHKQWLFLTGTQKDLTHMALNEYGIVNPEDVEEEGSFVHTEMFVLVDNDNNIRGYYNGMNEKEVGQMIIDMKELLKEQF